MKIPAPTDEELAALLKSHKGKAAVNIPKPVHDYLASKLPSPSDVDLAVTQIVTRELRRIRTTSKNVSGIKSVPIETRREYAAKARAAKAQNVLARRGLQPHNEKETATVRVRASEDVYAAFMALHPHRKRRVAVASEKIDRLLESSRDEVMMMATVAESGDKFITIHADTARRCGAVGREKNLSAAKIISSCMLLK